MQFIWVRHGNAAPISRPVVLLRERGKIETDDQVHDNWTSSLLLRTRGKSREFPISERNACLKRRACGSTGTAGRLVPRRLILNLTGRSAGSQGYDEIDSCPDGPWRAYLFLSPHMPAAVDYRTLSANVLPAGRIPTGRVVWTFVQMNNDIAGLTGTRVTGDVVFLRETRLHLITRCGHRPRTSEHSSDSSTVNTTLNGRHASRWSSSTAEVFIQRTATT